MLSACYFSRMLGEQLPLSLELAAAESNSKLSGITIAFHVMGAISALGCIFNIITTFLLKLHFNALGKMVIFLSIADIIFTITFIIETRSNIVSIIFSMSWAASVTMLGCFAHALYRAVKSDEGFLSTLLLTKYIITSLVISALIGVLCIIRLNTVVFSSLGTLALTAIVYSTFCYIFVLKKFREIKREIHLELLVYPLFLIICEFPFIVVQFHVIFKGQKPPAEDFRKVSMLLLVSRGLLNSLAYGLSSKVRLGFKTLCKSKKDVNQTDSYFTSFTDRPSMMTMSVKTPNYVLHDSTSPSQNESFLRNQHTKTNLIEKLLI